MSKSAVSLKVMSYYAYYYYYYFKPAKSRERLAAFKLR